MNKLALVTGANKGIGFEIARQLGEAGWKVLMGAHSTEQVKHQRLNCRTRD